MTYAGSRVLEHRPCDLSNNDIRKVNNQAATHLSSSSKNVNSGPDNLSTHDVSGPQSTNGLSDRWGTFKGEEMSTTTTTTALDSSPKGDVSAQTEIPRPHNCIPSPRLKGMLANVNWHKANAEEQVVDHFGSSYNNQFNEKSTDIIQYNITSSFSSEQTHWEENSHSLNRLVHGLNRKIVISSDDYGGLGLFAATDISAGEIVLTDLPSIVCCTDLKLMLDRLLTLKHHQLSHLISIPTHEECLTPSEDAEIVSVMSDKDDTETLKVFRWFVCLMKANAHGLGHKDHMTWGIYPVGVKVNHSCKPNLWYRNVKGELQYVAIRNIDKGEELTMAYTNHLFTSKDFRQSNLLKQKLFVCKCRRCQHDSVNVETCRLIECPFCRHMSEILPEFSSAGKRVENEFEDFRNHDAFIIDELASSVHDANQINAPSSSAAADPCLYSDYDTLGPLGNCWIQQSQGDHDESDEDDNEIQDDDDDDYQPTFLTLFDHSLTTISEKSYEDDSTTIDGDNNNNRESDSNLLTNSPLSPLNFPRRSSSACLRNPFDLNLRSLSPSVRSLSPVDHRRKSRSPLGLLKPSIDKIIQSKTDDWRDTKNHDGSYNESKSSVEATKESSESGGGDQQQRDGKRKFSEFSLQRCSILSSMDSDKWICSNCQLTIHNTEPPLATESLLQQTYQQLDVEFLLPDESTWFKKLGYLQVTILFALGRFHWLNAGCDYLASRFFFSAWHDQPNNEFRDQAFEKAFRFFEFVETYSPEAVTVDVIPWSSALMKLGLLSGDLKSFARLASKYLRVLEILYGIDDSHVLLFNTAVEYLASVGIQIYDWKQLDFDDDTRAHVQIETQRIVNAYEVKAALRDLAETAGGVIENDDDHYNAEHMHDDVRQQSAVPYNENDFKKELAIATRRRYQIDAIHFDDTPRPGSIFLPNNQFLKKTNHDHNSYFHLLSDETKEGEESEKNTSNASTTTLFSIKEAKEDEETTTVQNNYKMISAAAAAAKSIDLTKLDGEEQTNQDDDSSVSVKKYPLTVPPISIPKNRRALLPHHDDTLGQQQQQQLAGVGSTHIDRFESSVSENQLLLQQHYDDELETVLDKSRLHLALISPDVSRRHTLQKRRAKLPFQFMPANTTRFLPYRTPLSTNGFDAQDVAIQTSPRTSKFFKKATTKKTKPTMPSSTSAEPQKKTVVESSTCTTLDKVSKKSPAEPSTPVKVRRHGAKGGRGSSKNSCSNRKENNDRQGVGECQVTQETGNTSPSSNKKFKVKSQDLPRSQSESINQKSSKPKEESTSKRHHHHHQRENKMKVPNNSKSDHDVAAVVVVDGSSSLPKVSTSSQSELTKESTQLIGNLSQLDYRLEQECKVGPQRSLLTTTVEVKPVVVLQENSPLLPIVNPEMNSFRRYLVQHASSGVPMQTTSLSPLRAQIHQLRLPISSIASKVETYQTQSSLGGNGYDTNRIRKSFHAAADSPLMYSPSVRLDSQYSCTPHRLSIQSTPVSVVQEMLPPYLQSSSLSKANTQQCEKDLHHLRFIRQIHNGSGFSETASNQTFNSNQTLLTEHQSLYLDAAPSSQMAMDVGATRRPHIVGPKRIHLSVGGSAAAATKKGLDEVQNLRRTIPPTWAQGLPLKIPSSPFMEAHNRTTCFTSRESTSQGVHQISRSVSRQTLSCRPDSLSTPSLKFKSKKRLRSARKNTQI